MLDAGRLGQNSLEGARVALDGPSWLVLGQGYSEGWEATCDGRSLGEPRPVDGYERLARSRRLPAGELQLRASGSANVGYAISAGVCLLLGFLVAGWLAGYQRADAAPPPLLPQDGTPRITLPRAAAAALIATIPLCLLFALRSAVLIFPVLTLILWRGVGPRALTAVAAGLLGVVVPLVYAVTSPRDRGGFNFEYSIDLIWAHWVGVAALILLMVVCWRLLAAARRTRRPSGPSPTGGLPTDPETEADGRRLAPAGAARAG